MASPSKKRTRPGAALTVFVALLALIFGGIVANAELRDGRYLPQLGLDLAGGTTVTLSAVTEKNQPPPESQMNQAVNIIRQRVNGLGIAESEVTAQGENIIVQVPGKGQREVVQQVGKTAKLYFRQVLVTMPANNPQPSQTPSSSPSKSDGQNGKDGKNGEGANESVQPGGSPSQSSSGRALGEAMQSSGPQAKAVAPTDLPTGLPSNMPTNMPTNPQQQQPNLQGVDPALISKLQQLDCSDKKNHDKPENPKKQVVVCDQKRTEKFILGPAQVFGTSVDKAESVNDPQDLGKWKVTLDFNSKGTEQFGAVTTKANGEQGDRKRVAIELDREVISAPKINEPITNGTAEITGDFNQKSAQNLTNVLKYGALPLEFNQESISSVSPTLGNELLQGGLLAGLMGLAVVGVYVFLYYRGLGLVSVLSLLGCAGLTFGLVTLMSELIGYRLTLAGVGGLIVAIGITADSFIVYFERLRDEVREGKSLRQAVERSWGRARRTIMTADTVAFLAAVILYIVSVDQVRGFAFTLGVTTFIDILVVFLFTKPLMTLLVRTDFFGKGHRLSGLSPQSLGVSETVRSRTALVRTREA